MPHPSRLVDVKCATCGKPKKVPLSQYNFCKSKKFFCNQKCKGVWQDKRFKTKCTYCGKIITVGSWETKKNKTGNYFCNNECSSKFQRKRVVIQCFSCGKEMVLPPSVAYGYERKFCSFECRSKWMSESRMGENSPKWVEKIERPCSYCGKILLLNPSTVNTYEKTFCSPECKAGWYSANYNGENNPNWKGGLSYEPYGLDFNSDLKLKVRQRDNFTCQLCGAKENGRALDCHHIDYDKQNNSETNLVTLCQENGCHQKTNGRRAYWTKYFQTLLTEKYGYLYYKPLRNGFRRLRT